MRSAAMSDPAIVGGGLPACGSLTSLGRAEGAIPGTARRSELAARLRALTPDLLFSLLVVYNAFRLLHHDMWRDELQAFMLAAASATPLELFAKLKYEGHPGLWHLLLWVITRFTSDPIWMQVAHLMIALGIWLLIWRLSPFRPLEKLLLLLSYFLFWEYFVVSRSYALGVLLGLGFVAMRTHRPGQLFWPWVLLGLLANTSVFGTLWSLVMGGFFAAQHWQKWRAMLRGAGLYAAFMALAIATMIPASDFALYAAKPNLGSGNLDIALNFVAGAFLPFYAPFMPEALNMIGGPAARLAATPWGLETDSQLVALLAWLPEYAVVGLLLAVPLLVCFSIMRVSWRTAEFTVVYVGLLLFAQLWSFAGAPRHSGIIFIALIGTVWTWRSAVLPARPMATLWIALLVINVLGGLTTLTSGLYPFSQGRNAAAWLKHHHLEGVLLMATPDFAASSVAAYLRQPIYYLNSENFGTYVEWSSAAKKRA